MNKHAKFALFVIIAGAIVIVAVKFLYPVFMKQQAYKTSDAGNVKGEIRIALDSWIGYFPLQSPVFKKAMRNEGYMIKVTDDNADYGARMEGLKKGDIDIAVATVDSYILSGAEQQFPATIIAILDESKGGDAIIANKDKLTGIDDFKKKSGYKVAFTPDSPSEHLLKSVGSHFGIDTFLDAGGTWAVESNGAEEAYKMLMSNKVDAAVVWEPYVSRAIADDSYIKILGTEDTEKLIVDILLINRKYAEKNPEITALLIENYFLALKFYNDNPDELKADIKSTLREKDKNIDSMLKGVKWINLFENAHWFGLDDESGYTGDELSEVIESTIKILVENNDFPDNPLPNQDSYTIINSNFINVVYNKIHPQATASDDTNSLDDEFSSLTDKQWAKLKSVGTLKVRPITFMSGTSNIDDMGIAQIDTIVQNIKHYPRYRLLIKGHTGLRGDKDANKALSQERADGVRQYLIDVYDIHPNRINSIGLGSDEPLDKVDGESGRSYNDRLKRVEVTLVTEVF